MKTPSQPPGAAAPPGTFALCDGRPCVSELRQNTGFSSRRSCQRSGLMRWTHRRRQNLRPPHLTSLRSATFPSRGRLFCVPHPQGSMHPSTRPPFLSQGRDTRPARFVTFRCGLQRGGGINDPPASHTLGSPLYTRGPLLCRSPTYSERRCIGTKSAVVERGRFWYY